MISLPIPDRAEAGRLLASALRSYAGSDAVVLALPRGGVPVADPVARQLGLPLGVLLVRKLGMPGQPELAFGAIASGGAVVIDEGLAGMIDPEAVEAVKLQESAELARREQLYGAHTALAVAGKTVILVDDGMATGSTMLAAAQALRSRRPAEVVTAVPVASPRACHALRMEADRCMCLATPEPFDAVGQWYTDFRQVTDAEVLAILGPAVKPATC